MGTDGIFTGANEVYFASLSTGGLVEKTFTLAIVLGDMDLDGDVDFDDIDAFVLGLHSSSSYEELYGISPVVHGDLDGSGALDFDDIDDFVAVLAAPSQRAVHVVPEPATAVLAVLAAAVGGACGGRITFGRWVWSDR